MDVGKILTAPTRTMLLDIVAIAWKGLEGIPMISNKDA